MRPCSRCRQAYSRHIQRADGGLPLCPGAYPYRPPQACIMADGRCLNCGYGRDAHVNEGHMLTCPARTSAGPWAPLDPADNGDAAYARDRAGSGRP